MSRILIVDDEPALARLLARLLEREHQVTQELAEPALARMERGERFDLVLCDVLMPGVDGFELHDRVRAFDPDQARRFVVMTGNPEQHRDSLGERGCGRHLGKPFLTRELDEVVAQTLAAR